jgi:hypothetical protein
MFFCLVLWSVVLSPELCSFFALCPLLFARCPVAPQPCAEADQRFLIRLYE